MEIQKELSKTEIFEQIREWLRFNQYTIASEDTDRPWGGFIVIHESHVAQFRKQFFANLTFSAEQLNLKISPKILIVAPHTRLSWQYHNRRAEIWKLVGGEGAVVTSFTDKEGPLQTLALGQIIKMEQGERHRLVGLDNWGVVAEIWMHTAPENPSDEADIVRVQDDFKRV
ncbi:phosphoheptose isomerase [Penaeicola halotolerans]|uniref:phosphoheptose isomerase n=1 Tax=Penaeicola halotolerans TaxID=2793196 RepID=UPI001CF8B602|nr:phosphoheptose isomerase [Penaeicola halotolerans]